MSHQHALLIYDGDCTYCRGFARLLYRLDRRCQFDARPLSDADAHELLSAQFGAQTGFAMYLVEPDRVHWGANAAERVPALMAWPRWMSRLAFRIYPTLVRIVSWLSRRERTACSPGCAMGASNVGHDRGSVELSQEARDVFRRLMGDGAHEGDVLQPRA